MTQTIIQAPRTASPNNQNTFIKAHRPLLNTLRIAVPVTKGVRYLELEDITCIQAAAPYSYVHLSNGEKLFNNQSIRLFDFKLRQLGFVRVHKSWLVNVRSISFYKNDGHGSVLLTNDLQINFARGKKRLFITEMERFCV